MLIPGTQVRSSGISSLPRIATLMVSVDASYRGGIWSSADNASGVSAEPASAGSALSELACWRRAVR